MKTSVELTGVIVALMLSAPGTTTAESDGRARFNEHCAGCHLNGGNIINPAKTLDRATREANGITTWQDIVKILRNPGTGMPAFDKSVLSDADARSVADYIIRNFK